MILGYIRISTSLQDLKNQKNSINELCCTNKRQGKYKGKVEKKV